MKKAEKGDGLVIKFYQSMARDAEVRFKFKKMPKMAYVVDLLENPLGVIEDVRGHEVRVFVRGKGVMGVMVLF